MQIKKSFTITETQAEWVKAQIAAGRYGTESEVVRDLIRREQEREQEIEARRAALMDAACDDESERTPEQRLFESLIAAHELYAARR